MARTLSITLASVLSAATLACSSQPTAESRKQQKLNQLEHELKAEGFDAEKVTWDKATGKRLPAKRD